MLRLPLLEILASPEFELQCEYERWRAEQGYDRSREEFWRRWEEIEVLCAHRDRCAAIRSLAERMVEKLTVPKFMVWTPTGWICEP
jgi:hypothetical protein